MSSELATSALPASRFLTASYSCYRLPPTHRAPPTPYRLPLTAYHPLPMHLSLRKLGKDYHGVTALDDVTLDIPPGRIVALVGANGAGKSTLLHLLGTLLTPTRGEVLCDGELLQRDPGPPLS